MAMSVREASFQVARAEFEMAWHNPNHTRFVLPAVDINKILNERYRISPARQVTRDEIWEMEVKKAWDPLTYIPYVVSEGNSWGRRRLADGSEHWDRASRQVGWITGERGLVLEEVYVNHASEMILFMGRARMKREDGTELRASNHQPLFHVEHAVGGSAPRPENLWRIVVLTNLEDIRFCAPFEAMAKAGWLPGFVEIYLRRDLGMSLERLGTQAVS
jgi:hypothetical protein